MNPSPDRARGNPAPSHCPQQQGQTLPWAWHPGSLLNSLLSFLLLLIYGHRDPAELQACACAQVFIPGRSNHVGISSFVGRQNSRDGPHLCNKHTFPCCTPALWKPLMDQISTDPNRQAELHHWRACQALSDGSDSRQLGLRPLIYHGKHQGRERHCKH